MVITVCLIASLSATAQSKAKAGKQSPGAVQTTQQGYTLVSNEKPGAVGQVF
jgi:hypothetical protein